MDVQQIKKCHVVAMPYPGRGHINPMLNLSKLIATKRPDYVITFIVTEEWAAILQSESKPSNFQFSTIPNVIPSEQGRAADFAGFYKAALTKLEEPVERLLDGLETPASVIIYDTNLSWVVGVGNRRNIPVASLWTMSATMFSTSFFSDLLVKNGHLPVNLSDIKRREELVSCIPGIPPTPILDLLMTPFYGKGGEVLPEFQLAISLVPKVQYLLITSIYELESQVIDALKQHLHIQVYSIGPAIPYFRINDDLISRDENHFDYLKWLNAQPEASVLYISQGSFLSVSSVQLDEIVAGVHQSGVRFFWVARGDNSRFKGGAGDKGLVVPWCDQLNVLCHSSIGGFWSHCGWNSTKEGLYSGVPMLTLPIFFDQIPNSRMIVKDWKIGLNVKDGGDETLVNRNEIARLVKGFMDLESEEGKEMRKRAKELKEICRQATSKDGSADIDLDAFIHDISLESTIS